MIDEKTNPVPWSLLVSGLDDAREHLEKLVGEMAAKGSIEEEELRVALGHVYAHLNRAWHTRDRIDEVAEKDWVQLGRFPTDVDPVG
jgi:polyhydroxyalkanoate synthesis regulator phasin